MSTNVAPVPAPENACSSCELCIKLTLVAAATRGDQLRGTFSGLPSRTTTWPRLVASDDSGRARRQHLDEAMHDSYADLEEAVTARIGGSFPLLIFSSTSSRLVRRKAERSIYLPISFILRIHCAYLSVRLTYSRPLADASAARRLVDGCPDASRQVHAGERHARGPTIPRESLRCASSRENELGGWYQLSAPLCSSNSGHENEGVGVLPTPSFSLLLPSPLGRGRGWGYTRPHACGL